MEIKITPPDGYEIDYDKSTFSCIKFKPITKQNVVTKLKFGDCRINDLWAFTIFEREKGDEGEIVFGHNATLYLSTAFGKWCDESGKEIVNGDNGYLYFIPNEQ